MDGVARGLIKIVNLFCRKWVRMNCRGRLHVRKCMQPEPLLGHTLPQRCVFQGVDAAQPHSAH